MDRFIVGTGRCGSTLLSRMLAEHPSTLCIFEFFNGLDMARRFDARPLPGKAFAALISHHQPYVTLVVSRGYQVPEIVYPFDAARARYRRDDPLPYILASALPRLTGDPDALFDEAVAFASGLPEQQVALHYRRLFDWLSQRMERPFWIEKSGSSIDYLGSLHELFPRARFVHLHRDGPEAALSMREHAPYRLAVSLMYGLHDAGEALRAALGGIERETHRGGDDPIAKILASRPAVEHFGRYWSEQIVRGFRALPGLDADQVLAVRFEDLVSDPRGELRRIGAFFELDGNGWGERAAGLVRGIPPTRFEKLSDAERERLSRACRVGRQLVGRAP